MTKTKSPKLRTFGCGVFCEIGGRPQDEQGGSLDIGGNADYTNHVGNLNPIRYRGYYFDSETGLYFLHARYYDPTVCRFISRDDFSYLDPDTVNGINLFAYCLNNPVMFSDSTGHFAVSTAVVLIAMAVGVFVGAGAAAYADSVDDGGLNGSVGWQTYVGGALLGAGIGGLLALSLPAISAFAGTTFTVGGAYALATGEAVAVTVSGAQVLGAVALAGTVIAFQRIGKSGGYTFDHHYPNDHNPPHVHVSGDDGMTKIDLNGDPLPGQRGMTHGEKKAFMKLYETILQALKGYMS